MLELENVTASYGPTPILRGVDIRVEEGEVVGVMGKNGVGKTTLVKTVMGLLEADDGSVRFKGEEMTTSGAPGVVGRLRGSSPVQALADGAPDAARRAVGRFLSDGVSQRRADERARLGMGYIPQSRDVFPRLTVEQNLRLGEGINDDSDDDLYDLVYEYFPILQERKDQKAGTMSGGQQQMLAIGRALVGNPDLLLLDEPSEGIQPSIVEQIGEDIQRMNEELGLTVLFVEQNLDLVQTMADRCYALDKGEVVDELDAKDLRDADAVADYLAV
jgi:branched-chain amino acid transport system ATP-binding protein